MFKKKKESNRVSEIFNKYECGSDPVATTHSFVKEILNSQPDRYDMTYRYEHSLRVALWGKRIAEGEGWDSEPLVIGCLLHDVGYSLLESMDEWNKHPAYSARIAKAFLTKIGYCEELTENICQAISIHDKWNDVPEGVTPFELSVRDADDLDRYDVMRICMIGRSDIGEHSASELLEICDKRLQRVEDWQDRICGTDTAKKFWEEKLQIQRQFYKSLKEEMQGTFEMQKWLRER